jgi:NAD(P)-dependent dehydrogenase (short-subunit alcohol dehydrogenase family)
MQNFKDKIIVITGAGSGIGRALALAFAQQGAILALNDYQANSLAETQKLIEQQSTQKVFCSVFDVANKESIFVFAEAVVNHFGAVDVVINNAGVGLGAAVFDQVNLEYIERLFDINFKGVLYGCKAFIPHLLKRSESVLVNVASIFGLTGIAYGEAYSASKFAVNGLTLSLMQTYKNSNLTIQCVYPGGIKTNIVKNAIGKKSTEDSEFEAKFLKRSPESAAAIIIKGIKQKRSRILIGSEAHTLDIAVRIAPILGCKLVNRNISSEKK